MPYRALLLTLIWTRFSRQLKKETLRNGADCRLLLALIRKRGRDEGLFQLPITERGNMELNLLCRLIKRGNFPSGQSKEASQAQFLLSQILKNTREYQVKLLRLPGVF